MTEPKTGMLPETLAFVDASFSQSRGFLVIKPEPFGTRYLKSLQTKLLLDMNSYYIY